MLTIHRWPTVPRACWPNVGPNQRHQHVGPLTLALRRANMLALRRADEQNYIGPTCTYYHGQTLAQYRAYMLAYCWTNMITLRRTNMLALRRYYEQNYIGPMPFYDVGPTCTYNHGQMLAQHCHATWVRNLLFSTLQCLQLKSRRYTLRQTVIGKARGHSPINLENGP